MQLFRFTAAALLALQLVSAQAQDARKDALLVVNENGPNSLDIHGVGANRASYGVAWIAYDRLMSYGKKVVNGVPYYDYAKLEPELAESWQVAKDGMSVTFKLRKDARFHDGSPVTAEDVKWSYDRALGMGGFPQFQMSAGSLEKPEQFEVVDASTFRVKFLRKDKLSLPDMAVPVASIYNAKLAKAHATADDPWAAAWLKNNEAGGGAYKVASWKPGQEIVYERFDDWKNGPLPKLKRVIQREVANPGTRRALIEKGDADMSFEMPPKDFALLSQTKGDLVVKSTPVENAEWFIGMNYNKPPFNNPKVRQAVAWAVPYEKIYTRAFYGRVIKLWGAKSMNVTSADWPAVHGYSTDIAKAKALMAEAGYPNGFDTTLSFDLGNGTISEPIAVLLQESLNEIGIRTTINKVPGANWRAQMLKKEMPLFINRFGGWLNYPEYFFYWNFHSSDPVFNDSSYKNPAMDKLIDAARFETDKKKYEAQVKSFIDLAHKDLPRVPLGQPVMDVVMNKNISGYTYWFHIQPDYRQIEKK
ncbi:ABC transporter substrate-binding protein [Uliginosibacterium sediminicola]|uniref:ABC transporter substrate-binding protein n=1 Tax=Uliginosibacterium sediminicola TaxID=2024550 RepID=A0ABU9YWQ6_9RHOO